MELVIIQIFARVETHFPLVWNQVVTGAPFMCPDQGISHMDIQLYGISMIPYCPNTITLQSSTTKYDPRDPLLYGTFTWNTATVVVTTHITRRHWRSTMMQSPSLESPVLCYIHFLIQLTLPDSTYDFWSDYHFTIQVRSRKGVLKIQ